MKTKISVTRGLAEIKRLDAEISTLTQNTAFLALKPKMADFIKGVKAEEVQSKMKGDYDKLLAKINRRNELKSAIVLSNAKVVVEIAGEKMTVAEAIDRKNTIANEQRLLNQLKAQYSRVKQVVDDKNDEVSREADSRATANFGAKQKSDPVVYKKFVEDYIASREYEIVDPINIAKEIEKLNERITNFLTEVDFVLSESNALTQIEV